MREVKLPSGAVLKIGVNPFETSKALYQAMLEEMKGLPITSKEEVGNFYKNLLCISFSSKKIEVALWECFKKCQYCDVRGELKIDKDTFEPLEARADYVQVCMEVARENVDPFGNGLYAQYQMLLEKVAQSQL